MSLEEVNAAVNGTPREGPIVGGREAGPGGATEAGLPDPGFEGRVREVASNDELPPLWLLDLMRPAKAMANVAKTRVDEAPFREIALDIAKKNLRDADISAEEEEIKRWRGRLAPAGLADLIYGEVKAAAFHPPAPQSPGAVADLVREMYRHKSEKDASEVERAAGRRIQQAVEGLVQATESALRKAPDRVPGMVEEALSAIEAGLATDGGWDEVDALKAVGLRWTSFESSASQVNARARRKVRGAFAEAARARSIAAARQALEAEAARELSRWVGKIGESMGAVARRAGGVAKLQQELLGHLSGAGSADTSGGRSVLLPTQGRREVLQRVLTARGARDLGDLAQAYRRDLGGFAPTSAEEARRLASRLVDKVRADAGGQSDFALIGTESRARRIAAELNTIARPNGSVHFADRHVKVDTYEVATAEVPLAPPGFETIRDALIDELNRLNNKINIVDLPAEQSGIRVYREVGGLYSINFRAMSYLRAAYVLSADFGPHDPHPVWSELVEPRGFLGPHPPGHDGR